MNDTQFLYWLSERLVNVYKESPNVDFVHRLNKIAYSLSGEKPETVFWCAEKKHYMDTPEHYYVCLRR